MVKKVLLLKAPLIILSLRATCGRGVHNLRLAEATPYPLPAGLRFVTDRGLPSAIPIKVFGHVVYSWVCKHPYLYARSRRTSGQP